MLTLQHHGEINDAVGNAVQKLFDAVPGDIADKAAAVSQYSVAIESAISILENPDKSEFISNVSKIASPEACANTCYDDPFGRQLSFLSIVKGLFPRHV